MVSHRLTSHAADCCRIGDLVTADGQGRPAERVASPTSSAAGCVGRSSPFTWWFSRFQLHCDLPGPIYRLRPGRGFNEADGELELCRYLETGSRRTAPAQRPTRFAPVAATLQPRGRYMRQNLWPARAKPVKPWAGLHLPTGGRLQTCPTTLSAGEGLFAGEANTRGAVRVCRATTIERDALRPRREQTPARQTARIRLPKSLRGFCQPGIASHRPAVPPWPAAWRRTSKTMRLEAGSKRPGPEIADAMAEELVRLASGLSLETLRQQTGSWRRPQSDSHALRRQAGNT